MPTFVAPETVVPPGSTVPILMPPNRIPPTGPLFGPQRLVPPSGADLSRSPPPGADLSRPASLDGLSPTGPLFGHELRFPSPYAPAASGLAPGASGALDGRLRIQLDIPNLPEGARVTTETSGNVPKPEVNVGHTDPMAGF